MTQFLHFDENDILNALRDLPAPYLDMDVVSAEMIKDIHIDGSNLKLTVETKIPSVTFDKVLLEDIRQRLAHRLHEAGTIDLILRPNILGVGIAQQFGVLPGVKNTIAVASGKGGVGKSTVAVNLAIALARSGARVGLIDADIYGPSVPMMLGVNEHPAAYKDGEATRILPCDNFGVKLMSIGFFIEPENAVIWRGPMASGALKQFMSDVDWGELDYMIFDMPPGTGDIQLTLSQSLPLTGALIVTTPQDISLADARKGFAMFERVSVPILGIIENMSYYVCSHCGNRDEIFSHGGGRQTAENLQVPFLGEIPLTTAIREGGDAGVPITEQDPAGILAGCFFEAALNLAGQISKKIITGTSSPAIDISLDMGN
jgi:ATP-binding protein involved in chromosome partitioning